MNNVFVYLEIEGTTVADVSLELLTKGRKLANQLGCQLEAIAAGSGLAGIEKQVMTHRACFPTLLCPILLYLLIFLKKRNLKFA